MHDQLCGPLDHALLLSGCDCDAGTVAVQSFANFSTALYGSKKKQQGIVDYSQQALSISDVARQQVSHCD